MKMKEYAVSSDGSRNRTMDSVYAQIKMTA